MPSFITVVPGVRTIPGVEEFDYAVDDGVDLCVGDVIHVPFRKRQLPALIIQRKTTSAYADRAIKLINPVPLLRLGKTTALLLRRVAERTSTSKPTVFNAWIPQIPKRLSVIPAKAGIQNSVDRTTSETRFLTNRWRDPNGLIPTVGMLSGRILILTPWQHRAEQLAKELKASVLTADTPMVAAWNGVAGFVDGTSRILITTRLGAWIASQADTILLDEPENDDFKQDELSPRFDSRWVVEEAARLRPELRVIRFATTPRLEEQDIPWTSIPDIALDLTLEQWQGRSWSQVDALSQQTVTRIAEAIETEQAVCIIHPIRGERSRMACRDCGWSAKCPSCDFSVSLVNGQALCRRCGKRSDAPVACPSCGGLDLSRGRTGKDKLADQVTKHFNSQLVRVVDMTELQAGGVKRGSLVIVTDISLIGGVAEDIRRRERLVIAWRRLAASLASAEATAIIQGPEETVNDCSRWLTTESLKQTWEQERNERRAFGYPPEVRLIKVLIDGSEAEAMTVLADMEKVLPPSMTIRGPYPVPFRAKSRKQRFVLQVVAAPDTTDQTLFSLLDPFKKRAIIDLDPIAFFG